MVDWRKYELDIMLQATDTEIVRKLSEPEVILAIKEILRGGKAVLTSGGIGLLEKTDTWLYSIYYEVQLPDIPFEEMRRYIVLFASGDAPIEVYEVKPIKKKKIKRKKKGGRITWQN